MSQGLAALASSFSNTRAQLDQFLKNSNQLLTDNSGDLLPSVVDLHSAPATISEKIYVIVLNLDRTSQNLHEFSRQIHDNPDVLLSDKSVK